jgi:hypothetical protein
MSLVACAERAAPPLGDERVPGLVNIAELLGVLDALIKTCELLLLIGHLVQAR